MHNGCSGHRLTFSKRRSITFTVHSRALRPVIPQRTTRDSGISRLWLLTRSSTKYGRSIARRILRTALHWSARRLPGSKAACSRPSSYTNRPSARRTATALSTTRRSPTSSPRASTPHVASTRSRTRICSNARYCYQRWGADGKVRQLDDYIRTSERKSGRTCSDKHDRGACRTPGSRHGDQSLAGRIGRDGAGETDRHSHAHGD